MKQNTLQIAGALFLTVCAITVVITFGQCPWGAIAGCIMAAAGAYCLYRGIHGLFSSMEQVRAENCQTMRELQERLIRAIADMNTASECRSEQLMKQQKILSDSMNDKLETLLQKVGLISTDLENAGLLIDSLRNSLVGQEETSAPLLTVLTKTLNKILKHQEILSDAVNEKMENLIQKSEIAIADLEDTGSFVDSLCSALFGQEKLETPLVTELNETLNKLPGRIYDKEKEPLEQIKTAIQNGKESITEQLSLLEAALKTYMGSYQSYMERFSQLSEQDIQFISRLMENGDEL